VICKQIESDRPGENPRQSAANRMPTVTRSTINIHLARFSLDATKNIQDLAAPSLQCILKQHDISLDSGLVSMEECTIIYQLSAV